MTPIFPGQGRVPYTPLPKKEPAYSGPIVVARDEGIALVLVEQHATVALGLTEDAIVIERGVVAHRGRSADLLKDEKTLDRYIGMNLEPG